MSTRALSGTALPSAPDRCARPPEPTGGMLADEGDEGLQEALRQLRVQSAVRCGPSVAPEQSAAADGLSPPQGLSAASAPVATRPAAPLVANDAIRALLAQVEEAGPDPEAVAAANNAASQLGEEMRTRAWAALLVRSEQEMLGERQKAVARRRAVRRRVGAAAAMLSVCVGAGAVLIGSAKRSMPVPPGLAPATTYLQRAAALIDCRPDGPVACLSGTDLADALREINAEMARQLPGASMYACGAQRPNLGCSPLNKQPRLEATWYERGVMRRATIGLQAPAR